MLSITQHNNVIGTLNDLLAIKASPSAALCSLVWLLAMMAVPLSVEGCEINKRAI